MNTNAPQSLGRYHLLERIAVGGMAEVYRALARGISGFEKVVVVKRLLPQHQRDQEVLTMFVDEARLLARLRHPNIVEVYDIDHQDNEYFFALEHVDGVDLRALLDEKGGAPLPLGEALWLTTHVARALAYVHELEDEDGQKMGIVHRDVSPSNVLVDRDGHVKLVDFGVAKWHAQRSHTRHGVLKGKVNYMSPEQCRGEALDPRSDVFSLGVLLYELTMAERPFARHSDFETLKAIAEGHYVKPRARQPEFPEALEHIIGRALELRLEDRTPGMRSFIEQLERFASAAGVSVQAGQLPERVRRLKPAFALPDHLPEPESAPPVERTATAAASVAFPKPTSSASSKKLGARVAIWGVIGLGAIAAGVWLAGSPASAPPSPVAVTPAKGIDPQPQRSPAAAPAASAAAPKAPALTSPAIDSSPGGSRSGSAAASKATPKKGARNSSEPPRKAPEGRDTAVQAVVAEPAGPVAPALWDPDSPVPP